MCANLSFSSSPKLSEFLVNFVLSRHVVMHLHGGLPGALSWIQWLTPSWNICLQYWENTHFKSPNFVMALNILNILWAKPRNRLFSLLWKGFISRTFAKFLQEGSLLEGIETVAIVTLHEAVIGLQLSFVCTWTATRCSDFQKKAQLASLAHLSGEQRSQ